MVHQGVLMEIAGRFSGLISFHQLDQHARLAITVKQITALGREYGLRITSVAPDTASALTPEQDALSMRSAVSILEGMLTPLFLQAPPAWKSFSLSGLPGGLQLLPDYCGVSNSSTELLATSNL